MSNAPKRKKLEKKGEPQVYKGTQKFICCRCGTAYNRLTGYFPSSHSPMYRGLGYIPICNDCVDELYRYYRKVLEDDRLAVRRICMKLDLYWSNDLYSITEKTAGIKSRIRTYIGKSNILKYVDKTFDDTLKEEGEEYCKLYENIDDTQSELEETTSDKEEKNNQEIENAEKEAVAEPVTEDVSEEAVVEEDLPEIEQSVIDFWGSGYNPYFYIELERRYKDWTGGVEVTDPSERSLYKQISLLEATIVQDSAQGKPIDKNINTLNTLLGSMNLKPAQRKEDADAELEHMPLGVGIQKWEYYRPLPPIEEKQKDTSNIIKNITTWFFGHTCKMVGLRNSYCKMYEDAMEKLRVDHPEYEEEDDDSVLSDIFDRNTEDGDEQ